jgi:hypothetical protein
MLRLSRLRIVFLNGVVTAGLCLTISSVSAAATKQVILIDLSKSVGTSIGEYKLGVQQVLEQLNIGDTTVVLGITEDSFANPRVLLNEVVGFLNQPSDLTLADCSKVRGTINKPLCESRNRERENTWNSMVYNHLQRERERIISKWKVASDHLKANGLRTDVIGALKYSELFLLDGSQNEKFLVVFSDMRHNTRGIDLSSTSRVDPSLLQVIKKKGLLPRLKGVTVRIHGVLTHQKDPSYLDSLQDFWRRLFEDSGAKLEMFDVFLPRVGHNRHRVRSTVTA